MVETPPSSNTQKQEWLVLHRGFDTLALSVKANLPKDALQHFLRVQSDAQEDREDVLSDFNGILMHVKPYGGNGYATIASGGPLGATWFFKKPNPKDRWGIRVSFGSDFLATRGLGEARAHLEHVMERLGILHLEKDISISRADYCVDILAPDFELDPDNFVMSAATKRRDHYENHEKSVHGVSSKVSSVTIGSIKNRQVIVYDKRKEVLTRNKRIWWTIWQGALDRMLADGILSQPIKLCPSNPKTSRVMRVEFRAGKTLLKDRWRIADWESFFNRFGDLCRQTGDLIRYCDPNTGDRNRARWPNHLIWELACAEMNIDLFEMRSGISANVVKEVHRETHISLLLRNVVGCAITHAALHDATFDNIQQHLVSLADEISSNVARHPDKTLKHLEAVKAKYVFLRRPN